MSVTDQTPGKHTKGLAMREAFCVFDSGLNLSFLCSSLLSVAKSKNAASKNAMSCHREENDGPCLFT